MKTSMSKFAKGIVKRIKPQYIKKGGDKTKMHKQQNKLDNPKLVYLLCSRNDINLKKMDMINQLFLHSANSIDNSVMHNPVFLDQTSAIHHGRYLLGQPLIFKAYVEEAAIEANHENFILKKGSIESSNILGCYISAETIHYLKNPYFEQETVDVSLLSQAAISSSDIQTAI